MTTDFMLGETQDELSAPMRHAVTPTKPGGWGYAVCPQKPRVWVYDMAGEGMRFPSSFGVLCPACEDIVSLARGKGEADALSERIRHPSKWDWLKGVRKLI